MGKSYQQNILIFAIIALISQNLYTKPITNDDKKLYIDEQIRFADGLVKRQHYTLAISEYKRLINKFPNNKLVAEAWLQLAEAYALNNDFKQSFSIFDKFFKQFPNIKIVPAAKLRYALVLNKTTKQNRGKCLEILIKLKTAQKVPLIIKEAATYHLGMIYLKNKQIKKAEKEFTSIAFKSISNENDIFKIYSALELAKLQPDNALKILMPITKSTSIPLELLNDIIWEIANILYKNNQFKKAEIMFAKYAVLFPDTPKGDEAQYKRLECLYREKDYTTTLTELDKLLKNNKKQRKASNIKLYYLKSLTLKELKFYDKAEKTLEFILKNTSQKAKIKPLASFAYINTLLADNQQTKANKVVLQFINENKLPKNVLKDIILLLIDSSKNSPEYLSMLDKALQNFKKDSQSWTELQFKSAVLLEKIGNTDQAKKRYIEISQNGFPTLRPYALMRLAALAEASKNNKDALNIYKNILKTYPKSQLYPETLLKTAIILLKNQKEWIIALAYIDNIINKYPTTDAAKFAYFYKAFILFSENKLSDAEKILLTLQKNPSLNNTLKNDISIYIAWIELKRNNIEKTLKIINKDKALLKNAPTQFQLEFGKNILNKDANLAKQSFILSTQSKDIFEKQEAYTMLSEVEIKTGNIKPAITALRNANSIKTNKLLNANIKIKLANLLIKDKKENEAVLLLQECLENAINKKISSQARLGLAEILSQDPKRLNTANRYAMSVFILSNDKTVCSTAMLLSIKISLKQGNIEEAKSTWKEFATRFPALIKNKKASELKILIEKNSKE